MSGTHRIGERRRNTPARDDGVARTGPQDAGSEHTLPALPRDVGWFLLVSGLLTELGLPGVPPFWIFGVLILWPGPGARLAAPLQRRAPRMYAGCLRTLDRYAQDLERRYPPGRRSSRPRGQREAEDPR